MIGRILSIAGTDPSGGAGIQADIKTISALNAYAMAAVTALVAQNTMGVSAVLSVSEDFVVEQINGVLDDIGADAIKTGMLHRAGIIESVADVLRRKATSIPIVVDPVMVAKSGHLLLEENAIDALRKLLIPLAVLVTPNNPEAEMLTGMSIKGDDSAIEAGQAIISMGASAALMKGGHREGARVRDILVYAGGVEIFEANRIASNSTHGTGCTLSSALAAGLGQHLTLTNATKRAHAYVQQAILTAPGYGHGNGPLNHLHNVNPYEVS